MSYQIFKALEKKFLQKLFQEKSSIYFPSLQNKKIQNIEIERISPIWAKESCLSKYKIFFEKEKIRIIRGTAKKNRSKKEVWKIMNYLYHQGFKENGLAIARPIDFLEKINLLLYREVPGRPFSSIIEKGNYSQIEKNLKKIARWLIKLHKLRFQENKFKKAPFLGLKGYLKIFKKIKKFMPDLKDDLNSLPSLSFVEQIWQKKKILIHNDFYPGNIIVDQNVIYGVDFDRAGLGPPLMDIATICGSLEFPREIWELNLSKKEISDLQEIFFQTYCQLRKISYQKNKKLLQLFLAKIFLDQIHYYSAFAIRGWNFVDKETQRGFSFKIKSLILKVKKYLP